MKKINKKEKEQILNSIRRILEIEGFGGEDLIEIYEDKVNAMIEAGESPDDIAEWLQST